MVEAWAATLDLASTWVLTYLLHSAVLIGGAWLATRFIPVQPASRELVWRLAMLGGVVTATGAVLQPGPPERTAESRRVALSVDAVDDGLDSTRLLPASWVEGAAAMRVRATATDPTPECEEALRAVATSGGDGLPRVAELCEQSSGLDWRATLLLIWLVGAAGATVRLVTGRRAVRSLEDSLEEATPRSVALLAEVAGHAAGVRVASSCVLAAPCALPGRTIGLPTRCEDELSDEELRAVLAHELAHVSRRDVWWSGFFRVTAALLWVQPLNRFALRRADQAVELACDDWALSRTGERVGLATSISRVAEWTSGASQAAAVSMAGRGEGAAAERVRRILFGCGVPEPRWVGFAMALAIAAPLPWVPPVPRAPMSHASIQVETGALTRPVTGVFVPAAGDGPATVIHRVVIARMSTD